MEKPNRNDLFESVKPARALAVMAVPTIASQLIVLVYNLADTWFIGRTNNPYMIGASSLVLTLYLAAAALSNVFGVGGGSLMARLMGEKRTDDARRVASYSVAVAALCALVFSLSVLAFMDPLLRLLGASDNTYAYGRQYLMAAVVVGGVPTVLSMCMPMLLRNAGYSREAGLGARFLRGRCFALPFMMIGYHIVNTMNAVGRGRRSFMQAIIRHLILIIPLLVVLDRLFGLDGLIGAQLAADVINAGIALVFFRSVARGIAAERAGSA